MMNTAKVAICLAIVVVAAVPAAAASGHRATRVVPRDPSPGIITDSCSTVVVGPCRTHRDSA
jgi:hypothetical protein